MKAFNAFQAPWSTDENSSSDPITSLAKRDAASVIHRVTRTALIENLNTLSIDLLALSKDSALSPPVDSSPAVAKLRNKVIEEIKYCNEIQNKFNDKIEATPVSNQACLTYTMQLVGRIGNFREQLKRISYGKKCL